MSWRETQKRSSWFLRRSSDLVGEAVGFLEKWSFGSLESRWSLVGVSVEGVFLYEWFDGFVLRHFWGDDTIGSSSHGEEFCNWFRKMIPVPHFEIVFAVWMVGGWAY